ncbi:RHS repeat domain-containing protein [Pseudoalteromonas obscura]|uniref:RHS repeat-associated core domain-containing protein n=1 Tax=Pseudoalteromonas obscura TaxID=3048491 RepID=A0ABT7EQW7_9GAMM|nr:RHS repeat-associated core domain-containing protein [Pseudoalteromonas sp. P94(2023)]MDK2597442.1 RHS repeat-associated core domain-containing protein [Pseudoalteromonas sp. P94(2023)]
MCFCSEANQISAKRTNGGSTDYQRDVVYSARNKATHITVNGELVQFSYDTNNRRFKRVERNKTIFYVGALEIVKESGSEALSAQTYIRRNIGNDAVKTYHENGQESIQWLFTDHQGSVVAVVNHSGKLLKRFSYDVFGKQSEVLMPNNDIDKLNWALETGLFWTVASNQRAYTGHEPVKFGDDTRIIHMNGRIYDADTGRFMQTDPFVQATGNLQNYNRYSYVLNNPLSYTDPSGYLFKSLKKLNRKLIRSTAKVFGAEFVNIVGNIASAFCGPAVFACATAWNYDFTRAMGGSSTQALRAGVTGGLSAQAFSIIGQYFNGLGADNLKQFGSVEGAKAAGLIEFGDNMLTGGQVAAQIGVHAVVGGVSTEMSGGKFGHGFVSAGITKGAGGVFLPGGGDLEFSQIAKGAVISAIIGGTVSEITGGKFSNGARTGAMQYVLNQAGESIKSFVNRKQAEVLIHEPSGWGRSSFGHVAIRIGDKVYSFGPGGMDNLDVEDYMALNDFRSAVGSELALSQSQISNLENYLNNYNFEYNYIQNCGSPVTLGLRSIGVDIGINILPVNLGNAILNSGIVSGSNFYPQTAPRITPWYYPTENGPQVK